jgi:hypothetical protein
VTFEEEQVNVLLKERLAIAATREGHKTVIVRLEGRHKDADAAIIAHAPGCRVTGDAIHPRAGGQGQRRGQLGQRFVRCELAALSQAANEKPVIVKKRREGQCVFSKSGWPSLRRGPGEKD